MNDRHVVRGLGEVAVASPLFLFAPVCRPWHLRLGRDRLRGSRSDAR
jgi:hypothetical protein